MAQLIEQNRLTEALLPKRPTDGHVWDCFAVGCMVNRDARDKIREILNK